MALALRASPRRPRAATGYARILVAVADDAAPEAAVEVACRLAADRGAAIHVVTVVEIPELLPLDARMRDEELAAHKLVVRAQAVADRYGVKVSTAILRARDAGSAITETALTDESELVVLGSASRVRNGAHGRVVGQTVDYVLKHATSRVLLVRRRADESAPLRL
jgi:nucleotide-binding universal stress UspA family protein